MTLNVVHYEDRNFAKILVTVIDQRDWPDLHAACIIGDKPSVQGLLKSGANVHEEGFISRLRPLQIACLFGHGDVATILFDHGARNLNLYGRSLPRTALLYMATYSGHIDIVRFLLDRGADWAYQDKRGLTAIHLAARTGQVEVLQVLREYGGDIHCRAKYYGKTPLHCASRGKSLPMVDFVVENGASLIEEDEDGAYPIYNALVKGSTEIIERLLELGSPIDCAIRRKGWTPLHYAARYRSPGKTELLLAHGADPTKKDNKGRVPAMLTSRLDVKRLLEDAEVEWHLESPR